MTVDLQQSDDDTQASVPAHQIKKNRMQCLSLLKEAEALLSANSTEEALSVLCKALSFDPGRVTVIHKIGQCLDKMGQSDNAALCYRGVIPDSVNVEHFDSEQLATTVKISVHCDEVKLLPAYSYSSTAIEKPNRNPLDQKKYGQFNYVKTEAGASFCTDACNGSLWFDGYNTVAFDKNDNVIEEHIKGNEFACLQARVEAIPYKIEGTACFLDARSTGIYYHWMLDVLPKLGILEKAGLSLDSIDYFIVKAASKFQLETLKTLGVSSERIISADSAQLFTADRMLVPYLCNSLGGRVSSGLGVGMAQWIPPYLQQQFLPKNTTAEASKGRRIYISRSTRGSRNIANEAEVKEALVKRNFEIIEFEDYTVAGQAELMSQCDIVLGVHGAGFTNLSFCKPGTQVIEIFGDYIVPCYWALCAVASLEYSQYMAVSVSDPTIATDNPGAIVEVQRSKQIYVELQEFNAFLDSILEPDDG